ncbi:hypothetical protein [Rubrivirga sp.]|uniref:hypothetical protein n=1 Tax=Rubrivirga sp. TaxID=1885344 RepID=UPI003C748A2D
MHPFCLCAALALVACGSPDAAEPAALANALEAEAAAADEPSSEALQADAVEPSVALEAVPVVRDTVGLDRPQTATRTLNSEGMDYQEDVKLFETMSFSPNFATYVPDGWETHVVSTPGGMAAQLQFDLEAGIDVFMPYDQSNVMATFAEARDAVEGDVTDLATSGNLPEWAKAGYTWSHSDLYGETYVVEHGGTGLFLSVKAPLEYGDGFEPSSQLVLDEWRWLDDGSSLR